MAKKEKKIKRLRVLLVDGNNYVHRGYWAVEPLTTKEGFPTNAIKGTLNIILKDINELKPDRVVVIFDKGGRTSWRSEVYPEYKRSESRVKSKETDDYEKVKQQFKPIRQILKAMGFRLLGKKGVEADDFMGTLATEFEAQGCEVLISTNDKDMAQLVTKNVNIVTAKERELLDPAGIRVEYGVRPDQIVDYLTLLGDKVDNIPGVDKVGPKTAAGWLNQFGTLKELLARIDELIPKAEMGKNGKPKKPKKTPVVVEHLLAAKKKKWHKLGRKLIKLKLDIPHKVTLENCAFKDPDVERIEKLCKRYELKETLVQIKKHLKDRVKQSKGLW
jgi:DNA polymerase I